MTDAEILLDVEIEERRRKIAALPLMQFIPAITPQYFAPEHLKPLIDVLDRICSGEPVKVVCSSPPQHCKTESILHFISKYFLLHRDHNLAYVTYEATLAQTKSLQAQRIAERALVPFGDKQSMSQWETDKGGKLLVTGVGGPLTGHGLNGAIVDDPLKNAQEASSQLIRDRIEEWFNSVLATRLAPGGFIIVNMARWHEDDLYACLAKRKGWEIINIPAINEHGTALCPARKSIEDLLQYKAQSEYFFESLYQGNPRSIGSCVFRYPKEYDALPKLEMISIGIDMNYGHNPKGDYSIIFVEGRDVIGDRYVLEIWRDQVRSDEFKPILKFYKTKYKCPFYAFASSTEQGVIDLLNQDTDLQIKFIQAITNKFIRSQPAAGAWNTGHILWPSKQYQKEHGYPAWCDPCLSEILSFTGKNDKNDDVIDGLAGADYPYYSGLDYTGWEKHYGIGA